MIRKLTLVLSIVSLFPSLAAAATMTLSASRDTAVHQQSTGVNSGGQPSLAVGTAGGTLAHVLYHFDVSPLAGLYQSIDSITLRLFVSNNQASDANSDPGLDVFVHEISAANADWIEGNKSFAAASAGEPSWSHRQFNTATWAGTAGLSTAGTDYVTTPRASANVPSSAAVDSPVNFFFTGDLTALIDGWQTLNPGLILIPNTPTSTDRVFFRSREVLDTLVHPQLIVTFTEVPPVPEPASAVLCAGLGMLQLRRRRGAAAR